MSKISFEYKGEKYTLEYTRDSATALQLAGFDDSKIGTQGLVMIPLLFKYAFMEHHPKVKGAVIDDIFEHIVNKDDLIGKLAEMYYTTVSSLADEPEDSGKVEWTVSG